MTETQPTAASLTSLKGVGPKLQSQLQEAGIHAVSDILFHLPLRYEDRTRIHPVGALSPGQRVLIEGQVEHAAIVPGKRRMLVVMLADGSGRISLRFFHFRYSQYQQLKRGTRLRCFGEVKAGYQGLEMIHPNYQRLGDASPPPADRLTPIYPTAAGLNQATWLKLTDQAIARLHNGELALTELLPADVLEPLALPSLTDALQLIHRPPPEIDTAALEQRRHPAQQRLALEELLAHNLSMQRLHRQQRGQQAPAMSGQSRLETQFLEALPFTLTGAQQRVVKQIHADLKRPFPMQRLLQGDVGCGKTVVAALAVLRAHASGWQSAITAPTELLAEQHRHSFSEWLAPLGIEPVWLSGKVTGKAREKALGEIAAGAPLVIGTHALMQTGVSFSKLGFVVIDEQHRFGVHQRFALRQKGDQSGVTAHQLIMTATPIPRTLAMTAYAGLEVSVIDELPPGRQPVKTVALSGERRQEVIRRITKACESGRQAYWVCTLIEASDVLEAQAAEDTADELKAALPNVAVGLIHGRMKSRDKEAVMQSFKGGRIQLLVATTVIEVGVDVPNATLMIIENVERLGLAQLHQLRGRVGRGSAQASCVLMYQPPLGPTAKQRLNIMRETNDGFRIAEKDLELRGPGEVLGTRQTGALQFRIADLARDQALLAKIPRIADRMLTGYPQQADALIQRWIGQAERYAEV